jgi:hypothetical protein
MRIPRLDSFARLLTPKPEASAVCERRGPSPFWRICSERWEYPVIITMIIPEAFPRTVTRYRSWCYPVRVRDRPRNRVLPPITLRDSGAGRLDGPLRVDARCPTTPIRGLGMISLRRREPKHSMRRTVDRGSACFAWRTLMSAWQRRLSTPDGSAGLRVV